MKSGEVLTTDEAAARVQAEEKAKSDKIAEKAEKQRVAAAAKLARLELAAANKAAREKIAADRAAAKAAKAEALAAKQSEKAARRSVSVKRRAIPEGSQRQQGSLGGSGTLDAFLVPRNQSLAQQSHDAESVSSSSKSNGKEGSLNPATAGQGKVKPTRKAAKKDEGYYVEQPTYDDSDVDEPDYVDVTDIYKVDDYVIFELEEQCFPGIVTEVHSKTGSVSVFYGQI